MPRSSPVGLRSSLSRQSLSCGMAQFVEGGGTPGRSGWRRRSTGLRSYTAVRARGRVCTASGRLRSRGPGSRPEGAHRRPLDRCYCDPTRDSARLERRDLPRGAGARARNAPVRLNEPNPGFRTYPFGIRGLLCRGDGAAAGNQKGPVLRDLWTSWVRSRRFLCSNPIGFQGF
jgi:hypothetical protein